MSSVIRKKEKKKRSPLRTKEKKGREKKRVPTLIAMRRRGPAVTTPVAVKEGKRRERAIAASFPRKKKQNAPRSRLFGSKT